MMMTMLLLLLSQILLLSLCPESSRQDFVRKSADGEESKDQEQDPNGYTTKIG